MWGRWLIWFQFNVLHLIQTVIKYSQHKMPPEHGSSFKAKIVAKVLISSHISIHIDLGIISQMVFLRIHVILKILAQVLRR